MNADTYGDEGSDNEITTDGIDSGTTVTTGMDWGRNGDEDTHRYRKGLFIDLGCTAAGTAPKSCINVERLSELGVNPDMTFNMSYSNGSTNVKTGVIDADGFPVVRNRSPLGAPHLRKYASVFRLIQAVRPGQALHLQHFLDGRVHLLVLLPHTGPAVLQGL